MKIIEEKRLKEVILELNKFKDNHQTIDSLYNDLNNLDLASLQNSSYEQDDDLFGEVSFILNVITSIISHPHLTNKGEDVVLRTNQVGHVSSESFQKIFKEPQLWREKDLGMIPEYVHHYQYTDEIKIYENIFIGILINFIDEKLTKYLDFYVDLIPSFDVTTTELTSVDEVTTALNTIDQLKRKMRYIKNSHFYKEISTCDLSLRRITPTNILLKDRLYRYCYQFYLKYMRYEDKINLLDDFENYYYHLILQVFKENDFVLDSELSDDRNNLFFHYHDFTINMVLKKNIRGIYFNIFYHENKKIVAKHRLLFATERRLTKEFLEQLPSEEDEVITTEVLTIWNLHYLENIEIPVFNNTLKEKELILAYINSKLEVLQAPREVYKKYCPICKENNLYEYGKVNACPTCHSAYYFQDDDHLWFLKLRRP